MQYYRFFVGDYETDTGELSLTEHGAYLKLMNHYYSTRRPLPDDETKLRRVCGAVTAAEKRAVQTVLQRYFEQKDGSYIHQRIEQELIWQQKLSALQSTKARSPGSARVPTAAKPGFSHPDPEPYISQKIKKERASRIPENWSPNDKHKQIAAEKGCDLLVEAEKFKDWAKGGGKTYVDWDSTFNNWLRNDKYRSTDNGTYQRDSAKKAPAAVERTNEARSNIIDAARDRSSNRAGNNGRECKDDSQQRASRGVVQGLLSIPARTVN